MKTLTKQQRFGGRTFSTDDLQRKKASGICYAPESIWQVIMLENPSEFNMAALISGARKKG